MDEKSRRDSYRSLILQTKKCIQTYIENNNTLDDVKYLAGEYLSDEAGERIQSPGDLIKELESAEELEPSNIRVLKLFAEGLELKDLEEKIDNYELRGSGYAKTTVLHLRAVLKTRKAKVVLVGAAVISLIHWKPQILQYLQTALPVATQIVNLIDGSIIFVIETSCLSSLRQLWENYENGSLRKNFEEVINGIPELKELSNGEEIDVELFMQIYEEESHNGSQKLAACSIKQGITQGEVHSQEKDHRDRRLSELSSDDSEEDDFVKVYLTEDIETKTVSGLITADLTIFDIIANFPRFQNNVQVIRMSTNELEDVKGENCKIPNSFCQMHCLKELFLFGDAVRIGDGLSSLPKDFGNLKSLEVLNLEHNCFDTFPEQICGLTNLKKLYLNGCGLTSISPKINDIYNLVEADLSHNDFSSGLCEELFDLSKLKDLYLIKCQLKSLPEAIGNLVALEGLRLSDNSLEKFPEGLYSLQNLKKLVANKNRISELSPKIIGLQSLKTLSLSENNLKYLPDEVSKLPILQHLNVFGNKLTCLPESFKDLDPSTKIIVHGNDYLQKPPLSICSKGVESIRGYFSSMAKGKKKIHSNRIKIVMLGESGAGKTCLTRALVYCTACDSECNDSTIGVEMYRCYIGEDGLEACIVDCAGQRRYQLTHPFFLSEEALHIIVVNLKKYNPTQQSFEENVEDWINWVTARLLKPRIMIVATHRDECEDIEVMKKCEDILTRIKDHEKRENRRLEKEIKESRTKNISSQSDKERQDVEVRNLLWLQNNRPFISSKLLLNDDSNKDETNCLNLVPVSSKEELKGMILLRSELCRVVRSSSKKSEPTPEASSVKSHKEDALFPLVGIDLPGSWVDLEKAIMKYRMEVKPPKVPCMTFEQFEKFALEKARLKGSEVVSGLNYLDSIGEIKFYSQIPSTEYSVFLDLPWLCRLAKLLFRHDYDEDIFQFQEDYSYFGMENVMFDDHLSQLKEHGKLSASLLRCIWMELELSDIEFQNMIKSLVRFGLACEISESNIAADNEMWLFIPWFLHSELDVETKNNRFPDIPPSDVEELRLKFCISGYLPAGLFDRLCVRSYAHGIDADTWKNSMLIYIDDTPIYLQVNKTEITLIGRTTPKPDLRKLWIALLKIVKELRSLLSEWPRLVYNTYTVCPHCTRKQSSKPYHFPYKWWKKVDVWSRTTIRCKKSKVSCQMIDINLVVPPKDLVTRHESTYLPVTDTLLRELSQKIPEKWEAMGTFLGLSQDKLSTIKVNHRGNVSEQAYTMLQSWKTGQGKRASRLTLIEALERSERSDLECFLFSTV